MMVFRRVALACIAALLMTFAFEYAPAEAGGYCGYGCGAQVMVVQPQPVFQPCGCAAPTFYGAYAPTYYQPSYYGTNESAYYGEGYGAGSYGPAYEPGYGGGYYGGGYRPGFYGAGRRDFYRSAYRTGYLSGVYQGGYRRAFR
jgi:hypothetical protein